MFHRLDTDSGYSRLHSVTKKFAYFNFCEWNRMWCKYTDINFAIATVESRHTETGVVVI